MGVKTLWQRKLDLDLPSQTESLSNWILRVRSKKISCRQSRKRNLRVEAVLTYALTNAETELRTKQIRRFRRWQQVKGKLNIHRTKNENTQDDSSKSNYNIESNAWQAPLCSELSSLDTFMSMLNMVKVPSQR